VACFGKCYSPHLVALAKGLVCRMRALTVSVLGLCGMGGMGLLTRKGKNLVPAVLAVLGRVAHVLVARFSPSFTTPADPS
jgi:hypothetical protein